MKHSVNSFYLHQMQIFFLASVAFISIAAYAGDVTIGTRTNISNVVPFATLPTATTPGSRYQQAYSANGFTAIGAIQITGLTFIGGNGGSFRPGTYTLSLSTITNGIDSLSNSAFDSNLGGNNTFFESVYLSGAAPANLTFTGDVFSYDPSMGNLLLDIAISPAGPQPSGRIASYSSDTPSAFGSGVFSRYDNFTSGNIGYGLVTIFHYDPVISSPAPVPEPSSLFLLASAAVVSRVVRKK